MDGHRVLGHPRLTAGLSSLPGAKSSPADSLLNIVDVELIYGGAIHPQGKGSFLDVSNTLGLKGVLFLPHTTPAMDFHACSWTPLAVP